MVFTKFGFKFLLINGKIGLSFFHAVFAVFDKAEKA